MLRPENDGACSRHYRRGSRKTRPGHSADDRRISVKVGEAEHPMMEAHYIMFICIETSRGHQIKYLNPGEKPEAEFLLADGEELIAAYEYCNLHGLWKA